MSAKHTLGPWRVAPPGVYTSGVNVDAFAGGYVALIGGGISDPVMADARLIAAAPDLLEALEEFVKSFNEFEITNASSSDLDHIGRLHVIARAAIAKARGEA